MKLEQSMIDRLDRIKSEVVGTCEVCNGVGYLEEGEDTATCKCMKVFIYVMGLVIAGIPQDYWKLRLDDLDMDEKYLDLASFYIEHFDGAVASGSGILFHGSNGIGKTSLMCEIGKAALAQGYTVQYFTAQQYVDLRNDKGAVFKRYEGARFILLDEIDKVYINRSSGFATKALEEFIRRSLSEQHCMIICSNLDREEFSETFGDSVVSMAKRHMRVVDVVGSDYSDNLHDDWAQRMENPGYDYYDDAIAEMAELLDTQKREGYLG